MVVSIFAFIMEIDVMQYKRNFFTRRQVMKTALAGGVMASGMTQFIPGYAQVPSDGFSAGRILQGREFDLTIEETPVNFTGTPRLATTINGSIPAPTLRWREGDTVTIRVTNRLNVDSSIHWHGILLPYQMDGVPGISFKGIAPGETFV
jgi:FtsP/CotA-like multicopper oxidase with cupredoxin domain